VISTVSPVGGFLLPRKYDCGQQAIGGGGCSECEEKKGTLQRKASHGEPANHVPPIVHQVLGSPGQPLDGRVAESENVLVTETGRRNTGMVGGHGHYDEVEVIPANNSAVALFGGNAPRYVRSYLLQPIP
jgi:hypothetical protein